MECCEKRKGELEQGRMVI